LQGADRIGIGIGIGIGGGGRSGMHETTLTPVEREIISLIARGQSVKVIAHSLGIPPRTVDRYIEVCRRKFGARNNAELVLKAIGAGQLTSPDSST
jgi:DNA-binding NarL/FixJ family response regulator